MKGIFDRALPTRSEQGQQKEMLFIQLDHTTMKISQVADEISSLPGEILPVYVMVRHFPINGCWQRQMNIPGVMHNWEVTSSRYTDVKVPNFYLGIGS